MSKKDYYTRKPFDSIPDLENGVHMKFSPNKSTSLLCQKKNLFGGGKEDNKAQYNCTASDNHNVHIVDDKITHFTLP